ncbi:MAG: hypothetical protein HZC38_18455 [Chloroflexi bacterium]|nr:hypothetical protein [Chloroflexota bacterium]
MLPSGSSDSLLSVVTGRNFYDDIYRTRIKDETRLVELKSSRHTKVLRYENDLAIIEIGYDQIVAYIYKKIVVAQHAHERESLRELLESINQDFRYQDQVVTDNPRIIANLLEDGTASIYDKRNTSRINQIRVRTYAYSSRHFAYSERYFYFADNTLFLRVLDGIS